MQRNSWTKPYTQNFQTSSSNEPNRALKIFRPPQATSNREQSSCSAVAKPSTRNQQPCCCAFVVVLAFSLASLTVTEIPTLGFSELMALQAAMCWLCSCFLVSLWLFLYPSTFKCLLSLVSNGLVCEMVCLLLLVFFAVRLPVSLANTRHGIGYLRSDDTILWSDDLTERFRIV